MNTFVNGMGAGSRPDYYIVRDERYEYVIKRDREGSHLLTRSLDREHTYNSILSDLKVSVCEATMGEMLEGVFGQPGCHAGKVNTSQQSELMQPVKEPEKSEQVRQKRTSKARFNGHSLEPYCQIHLRDKYRDGKTPAGRQKYRCPLCDRKEPAITDPAQANKGVRRRKAGSSRHSARKGTKARVSPWRAAQAASVASKVKKNPKCATCGERLRISGRHRNKDGSTTTYFKCVNKCSQPKAEPDWRSWSGEQLEEHFRKVVERVNGHDPQIRDDVVHAMIAALIERTRDFGELHHPKVIKKFINSQARLSQDKHDLLPLDAPMKRDEESGLTYADQLRSSGMNPEEELIAKEGRVTN